MQRCRKAQPDSLPHCKVGPRTGDPRTGDPPLPPPPAGARSCAGRLPSNGRGLLYAGPQPLRCKPASLQRTAPGNPALHPSHTVPGGLCLRGVRKGPGSKHRASQQSRQERCPQRAAGVLLSQGFLKGAGNHLPFRPTATPRTPPANIPRTGNLPEPPPPPPSPVLAPMRLLTPSPSWSVALVWGRKQHPVSVCCTPFLLGSGWGTQG